MHEIALILLGTALVNNVLLAQTLGVSALLGMSASRKSAALGRTLDFAAATGLLLVTGTGANHLLYHGLLVPLQIAYLALPVFVLVIAMAAHLILTGSRRLRHRHHRQLEARRNLLIANAAVLGVALSEVAGTASLPLALLGALGAALGFALVLVLLAGLREQLVEGAVPRPFRGSAIAMITAGLMALAFMGFSGLARL